MKIYQCLALILAISGSMILSGCTTSPSQQQLQKQSQPKLADKILVATAFICLVELGNVSAWIVSLILAREFAITGFRTIAVSSGKTIAASSLGKIKTATQMIAIILLLLNNPIFNKYNIPLDKIMLYIALFFTLLSGFDYIYKNKEVFKD